MTCVPKYSDTGNRASHRDPAEPVPARAAAPETPREKETSGAPDIDLQAPGFHAGNRGNSWPFAAVASGLLLACSLALLPALPLVAGILLILWAVSSPERKFVGALMLSLVVVYLYLVYVAASESLFLTWRECAALVLAIASGLFGRLRHDHALRSLSARNLLLERLAAVDDLTGAYSRHHVLELGRREFHRSRRTGRAISILLMDMDNLKAINDGFGHAAGNEALRVLGSTLLANTRSPDLVGRYGGDEFLIVLTDAALDAARDSAARLQSTIRNLDLESDGKPIHSSVSIGVASVSPETPDLDSLIAAADRALYEAKTAGRDRIRWSGPVVDPSCRSLAAGGK